MSDGRESRSRQALAAEQAAGRATDPSRRMRLSVEGDEPLVFEVGPDEGPWADDGVAGRSSHSGVRPLPPSAADRSAGRSRHEVTVDGWVFNVTAEPAARAELRERAGRAAARSGPTGSITIRAQIPGRLLRVWVAVGDDVETGQRVLAIEAMKMENEVRAPRAGRVASISAHEGDLVELGDELMKLE